MTSISDSNTKNDKEKNDKDNKWKGMGIRTKLIKKTTLISGTCTPEALTSDSTLSLPVHTLTFEIPTDEKVPTTTGGKAIPHDLVQIDLGDIVKMVIPGYKPKSYSMSALRPGEFDITLKIYPNGRSSGYLDRLQVGDTIDSFGMKKNKTRQPPLDGGIVGFIAYGVGITEAWPIAKAELEQHHSKVVLLWASRKRADTIWNDEMEVYKNKYPADQLRIVNIFSREKVDGSLHGRINPDVLSNVFKKDNGNNTSQGKSRFLSVGTKPMMAMTDEMLAEIGFPMPEHALLASIK